MHSRHKHTIFMIGWEYPPLITGGLGIACRGLARALAARGHRVHFLVPRVPDGPFIDEGVHVFSPADHSFRPEEQDQLRVEIAHFQGGRTPGAYESPGRGEPGQTLAVDGPRSFTVSGSLEMLTGGYGDRIYAEVELYARAAGFIAASIGADVIHAHDWMAFPAGLAARASTGRPLVCHVHATEFDRSGELVNQRIYDIERAAFHGADHVVTVSNYTRNIVLHRYSMPEEKVTPVHNAIEFELPSAIVAKEPRKIRDRIVLFLGRITFQKGPDYFVRAARIVIEKIKNVRFVMVGTGDMYTRMLEMAADLGVGKHFHYTGFMNRRQVERIYKMSDLYVMPSVSEPFGISPLEAMIHGVPVIVSKQSGVSEVISNCIKVDFWDVDALAESMVNVLSKSELHAQLRRAGEEEVRRFSWQTPAERVENVYERLIAR
ncbi:MAG: glycosyltransferase family 4 protein [Spirochaetales bacterium]|nr:glycosyltransferase family 4 protein [Leptospiraceae bacterium]MCP5483833.1 glycosyltransferase family 4 protein [Spirochaetales bacterium]